MKKVLTITAILLSGFTLVAFVQSQQDNKPKATYQVGLSKVTVWENMNDDSTTWKNFTIERVYKKGGQWMSTSSFNQTDLLELRAAIDQAINAEVVKVK